MSNLQKKLALCLLFMVFASIWLIIHGAKIGKIGTVSSDDFQNISYAHHMLEYGVFTAEKGGNSVTPNEYHPPVFGTPSGWREPGYPAFIATVLFVDKLINRNQSQELFVNGELSHSHSGVVLLQASQVILLFAVALLVYLLTFTLSKNIPISLFGSVLTLFNPFLVQSALSVGWVECFQAFLLLGISIILFRVSEEYSTFRMFFLGVLLGFITLTSGLWLYFIPLVFLIVFWIGVEKYGFIKSLYFSLILAIAASTLPAAWIARNYIQFDRAAISFKGGLVLDVRANMAQMTVDEFRKSFFYWSGSRYFKDIAISMGNTERLETHGPKSFFRSALDRRLDLNTQTARTSLADKFQTNEAKSKIKSGFIMHSALVAPLSLRLVSDWFPFGAILLLFTFSLFLLMLVRGKNSFVLSMCPFVYYFSFLVLLSHGLPRYGIVSYPLIICFGLMGILFLVRRLYVSSCKWFG